MSEVIPFYEDHHNNKHMQIISGDPILNARVHHGTGNDYRAVSDSSAV